MIRGKLGRCLLAHVVFKNSSKNGGRCIRSDGAYFECSTFYHYQICFIIIIIINIIIIILLLNPHFKFVFLVLLGDVGLYVD